MNKRNAGPLADRERGPGQGVKMLNVLDLSDDDKRFLVGLKSLGWSDKSALRELVLVKSPDTLPPGLKQYAVKNNLL